MVLRSTEIYDELNDWINHFRIKMLELQKQSVPYATMLNMLGRFGSWILTHPEELTDKQKQVILDIVQEVNKYQPPYSKVLWKDKYLEYMIPDILKENIKEPWKLK